MGSLLNCSKVKPSAAFSALHICSSMCSRRFLSLRNSLID